MIKDNKYKASPVKKLSIEQKETLTSSYPSPNKINHLIKPDFSPILFQENNFFAKTKGSYKIQKKIEPKSPNKAPNTDYLTPIKIQGKDLFGIKHDKKYCRKLNFDNIDEKSIEFKNNINNNNKSIEKDLIENNNNNDFLKIIRNDKIDIDDINFNNNINNINNKNGLEKNINSEQNIKYDNDKMETDFIIIKTITSNKFDAVYKVKEKRTNKIFCIKKISEKSNKNNFILLPKILDDIQKKIDFLEISKKFCIEIIDYWIEEQIFYLKEKERNYSEKSIYILTQFYPTGDILDYLEKLEKINYKFTPSFYWDLIFEMMIGLLSLHKKGYIHFDIKPTKYLVTNDGYILLNDFGLSHKIEELKNLDDIIEGDSKYISKELFESINNISLRKINYKTDIFSLGLSILEILAKIDLPKNGKLWRFIRDSGEKILTEKFFVNCNISDNKDFIDLIKKMIAPISERLDLIDLINSTTELKKRYVLLEKNVYKKESGLI